MRSLFTRARGAVLVLALAAAAAGAATAGAGPARKHAASPQRAILFSSDGMRPDLMWKYAHRGLMPTYLSLIRDGVVGANGMRQAFPPNTGVGWTTMASGAYPAQHGSTNNTFYDTTTPWTTSTSAFQPGVIEADTLEQDAERNGKEVVCFEWVDCSDVSPQIQGPVVDGDSTYAKSAALVNFDLPGQPAKAAPFGFAASYERVTLAPATGWTNVPASHSPARETTLVLSTTRSSVNPDRSYDLYVYDSTDDGTVDYDHVLAVPATAGKDGHAAVADLKQGDWADVKVTLAGASAGQTAGFWLKAIRISPDLTQLWLYATQIARVNATYNGCTCSGSFEQTLASSFPSYTAADFAPLEGGLIDEDTYVQQGLDLYQRSHVPMLKHILGLLPKQPDLLMLGYPVTDEFQHQFLGLLDPSSPQGGANPSYDDADLNGVRDGRVKERTGYIESAYRGADQTLALARSLLGSGETAVVAASDHGFSQQFLAINADEVLHRAGLMQSSSASNCRPTDPADQAKACWAGGTAQVYVNPSLPADQKAAVVDKVVKAFTALDDPSHPSWKPVLRVLTKDQLTNVDGSNSLYPTRSGDVVVVARPPYQFDAPTVGQTIAPSGFFGQHGYLPDTVDIGHDVNMHATFVAGGAGIARIGRQIPGVQAVDLAPTVADVLGIPAPSDAQGHVLTQILSGHAAKRVARAAKKPKAHGNLGKHEGRGKHGHGRR